MCRKYGFFRNPNRIIIPAALLFFYGCLFSEEDAVVAPDYLRGLALKGEMKYPESAAHFKRCIENEPEFARAYVQLASVNQIMGKQADARQFFNALMGADQKNSFAWFGLGLVSQEQHNDSLAVLFFKKAIDLNLNCGMFYTKLIDINFSKTHQLSLAFSG